MSFQTVCEMQLQLCSTREIEMTPWEKQGPFHAQLQQTTQVELSAVWILAISLTILAYKHYYCCEWLFHFLCKALWITTVYEMCYINKLAVPCLANMASYQDIINAWTLLL